MKRKFILGSGAIVTGLILAAIGLWILLSPVEYQAKAKMEIEPYVEVDYDSSGHPYVPYDPYFLETEFKIINGDVVLSNVVETLNLNTQWGKRSGRTFETSETIPLLKQRMDLSIDRNTKIVEIRVTDEDPNEAAQIANTITKAYSDYRIAQNKQQMANGIKILDEDCVKEEAKISLVQSNVDRLYGQLRIVDDAYKNSGSSGPVLTLDEQPQLKEVIIKDEADYKKLTNELAELQSIQATNPAALRKVLSAMSGDTVLPDLLRQLDDKMRKLGAETNGVEGTSSDRAAIQTSIVELNQKIDARVDGLMITLRARSDYAKTASDALSKMLEKIETVGRPYWEAKQDLDSEKEIYELLKAKIEADKADANTPHVLPVTLIAPAIAPKSPSGPNYKLGAALFVCGLALSGFGFYSLRNTGKVSKA